MRRFWKWLKAQIVDDDPYDGWYVTKTVSRPMTDDEVREIEKHMAEVRELVDASLKVFDTPFFTGKPKRPKRSRRPTDGVVAEALLREAGCRGEVEERPDD